MQTQVAYDILTEGWPIGLFLLHFGIVLLALMLGCGYLKSRRTSHPFPKGAAVVGALVLAGGFLSYFGVYSERYHCRKWAREGNFSVIEGVVENFHAEPIGGHGPETFTVGGVFFACSPNNLDRAGFNRTSRGGSPIRPGLHVKICSHDGRILKLELLPSSSQNAPPR
jgi:hypothetical protein